MDTSSDKLYNILKSLPNKLTFARIAIIPILLILYPWNYPALRFICAVLFLIAALTDYFDGYLARKYHGVTRLGAILDPISDKILVASAILLLTNAHQIPAWIAAIVLCREIAISGLRIAAAESQFRIDVSQIGKYKTAAQDLAIFLLMLSLPSLHNTGMVLIWVSIGFSYFSAYQYSWQFWQNMKSRPDLNQ